MNAYHINGSFNIYYTIKFIENKLHIAHTLEHGLMFEPNQFNTVLSLMINAIHVNGSFFVVFSIVGRYLNVTR